MSKTASASNLSCFLSRELWLAAIIFLAGCESLTSTNSAVNWPTHQQELQQLTQFTARGKLTYQDTQTSENVRFAFIEKSQLSQLSILDPLGSTVMTLTITPTQSKIVVDDKTYYGQDANQLVEKMTGLKVPVAQLSDWIKGLPTGADHVEYGANNAVSRLEKKIDNCTWVIHYQQYAQTNRPNFILPSKINLKRDNTKVNIMLNAWDLNDND